MRIIVLGARGDVGSRVVAEVLFREHEVTAVVRTEAQLDQLLQTVTARVADVESSEHLAALIAGQDLVITAVRPPDGREKTLVPLTRSVLNASALAQVPVLIVGGAASLKVPGRNGATVVTDPGFLPDSVVPIARACFMQYELCAAETRADWSYLCPPAMLLPGERTGRYRVGSDVMLVDAEGDSRISMEDFAVALLDEAEQPKHRRARFTVAN